MLGAALFVALMTGGYYYNVTFVQLGLLDLGTRLVGMTRVQTSIGMAALALGAVAVALVVGVAMDRRGWSADLLAKLRLLLGVVVLQLVLTAVAPFVATVPAFAAWVAGCALSIGVGLPVAFSMAVDLVPVADRGYVAAAIAGLSFALAAVYPVEWNVGSFSLVVTLAMLPAVPVLAVLASGRLAVVDELARQHERRAFGAGRFTRGRPVGVRTLTFWTLLVVMFGVYFVDSLGFLRIVETEALVAVAWQSPDLGPRVAIAGVHLVGAGAAGVLYRNFDRDWLFVWTFGVFAVSHLLYTFGFRLAPLGGAGTLAPPLYYAVAVSFYTTLNFALWPDVSTPRTVGTHAALGVGVAGFLATFLSTAVSLYFRATGVSAYGHLNVTSALGLLLFVGVVVLLYVRRGLAAARADRSHTRTTGGDPR